MNDLFNLSDFQGRVISYKYHLNDREALRAGFDLGGVDSDEERDQNQTMRDTTFYENGLVEFQEILSEEDGNRESSSINFRLTGQYLRYFSPLNEIKVYAGVGPTVSYDKQNSEDEVDQNDRSLRTFLDTTYQDEININRADLHSSSRQKMIGIGINTVLGVEWLVLEYIGISAEYGYSIKYEYRETSDSIQLERWIE